MNLNFKKLMLAATVAAFSFAAPAAAEGEKYVVVTHGPDSDTWFNAFKNAMNLAGEQMNVEVEYRNPPTGDIADMARIIEQVTASGPNGLVVTLADFDVLEGPIKAAVASGVDVIVVNTGTAEQAREVGALMYIGQPEYDAGFAAGMRAKDDGISSFVCVNHTIQQPSLVERCQGFADGLGVDLRDSMLDSGIDPAEVKNKVLAFLQTNPDVEAILTLGPNSADPTIAAVKENGLAGDIYFGTFDLGDEIVKAIKDGTINWAIDQQPFLQAYMPIVIMTNYHRYGVLPGNNINSGPGFVTVDSLGKVEEFAGEYR